MASILDILNTTTGEQLIGKITETTGVEKEKAVTALGMTMPIILGILKNSSEDPKKVEKLNKALDTDKHDGQLLNSLKNSETEKLSEEGEKILHHLMGNKRGNIESFLASTLHLHKEDVGKIFSLATPVIMNLLGSQKRKDKVKASGLSGLIGSVLGSSAAHESSFVESLSNRDEDANVIDDVRGMVIGGGKGGKKGDSVLKGFTGGK
ncbi:DUF937 domain-containing protein [Autumnicola musiva]|uniref:DUF937 domain-containing protein n=1 Tax=Autumnicola musiva TaxID=3075589 RepID=A0ABU3D5N0_9FLAO|nr:DUF937 domain-containing protein [Zunongwangia sp. F117]MDT0676844.1 DUF937 domain-containing protein [Zunongwangia sp. F117]